MSSGNTESVLQLHVALLRKTNGLYSREVVATRRKVRGLIRMIRFTLVAAEARLCAVPESTDPDSSWHRCRAEWAVMTELGDLYKQVATLLKAKLAEPLDYTSEKGFVVSFCRVAEWARLCGAFCDLGRAMVCGPAGARFHGWQPEFFT